MRLRRRLRPPGDLPVRAVSVTARERQALADERSAAAALTDEQERAAARRQGSLLLAAGAGSGKTSVLVERFARAVEQDQIAPGRILAITFTDRAAAELRERVRARLLELGSREAAQAAEAAFVSTFHGFCARLLRAHALQAGLEPSFRILEEAVASRLRAAAFEDALAELASASGEPAIDLVAAVGAERLSTMTIGAHAQLRSQGQATPRLPRAEELAACALLDRLLVAFGVAYERHKRGREALDFDDLELRARDLLLADAQLRRDWSERFELLMVDEFQDSNRRQLQILAALDRDNLFTVGDELQSIYGFRHAEVSLFRERDERLATQEASLALTRNFRSRPPILEAVQRVFGERMGRRFAPLRATRPPTPDPCVELLVTDRRGWESARGAADLVGAPEAIPWRRAEARQLAARVEELVVAGEARPAEVAVLLRALGDLPLFESALRRCGLPTVAAVGSFWSQQQVVDLLAWLRALANPLDEPACYSLLACPLVGLRSDSLALIAAAARERGGGVWAAVGELDLGASSALVEADRARLAWFRDLYAAERGAAATRPIAELLIRVIEASGYESYLATRDEPERRLAAMRKLTRLARAFEAQEGRDLRGFLDHATHAEIAPEAREAEGGAYEQLEAVRLMSIHAAKGLEFPVVCVCDLGREPNLRQPDLLVDAEAGRLGVRLPDLHSGETTAWLDYEELCVQRRAAQEEEEDRILYVACTRARERLILSGAANFERWPSPRPGAAPIAWLAPALVPDVVELAAGSQPGRAVTVSLGERLSVRCLFNSVLAPAAAASGAGAVEGADSHESAQTTPTSTGECPAGSGDAERAAAELTPGERARAAQPPDGSACNAPPPEDFVRAAQPPDQPARPAPSARPHADPDTAVSYSSLVELERCGYRYYLERVLRLPERREVGRAGGGGLDARLRGTIVHALLEQLDFAAKPPGAQAVERAARRVGASPSKRERREIVELLAGALASEPAARLRSLGQGRREHPFAFSLGAEEPLVGGVIDLLFDLPDGSALIVDYKSDRIDAKDDLELLVGRDYGLQRQLYALAAIEAGAARVEVAHWFLERPRRWASASFGADERGLLRERLRARLAALRERGFVVSADPHRDLCLTCPGRGGLCSWGETHTMAARSTTLAIAQ